MKTSLIISTFNWPEALQLVLNSVLNQKQLPNEVIVADDGSTKETKELIEKFKKIFKVPLIHVWHEDNGFQKSQILNKAVVKAKGDYIIQVDGDCILHKNFIKDHLEKSEKGTYLYGSRVNIQKEYLNELFENKKIKFNFLSRGIKKRTRAIHNSILSLAYKRKSLFSKKYRGCNTSYFKKDFISVNGYNEDFNGWGREDSEFAIRLHNKGVFSKRLRYAGIVFHIWHKELSKGNLEANNSIELETLKVNSTWTKNGVDKYLNNG